MTAAPARPTLHAMTPAQLKNLRRELESAIAYFGRQHPVPPIHADLQDRLDAIAIVRAPAPGARMREHDLARQLRAVPDDELATIRRDLQATIAMMRHGSPMQAPATVYLAAVTAELDRRARNPASPP